MKTIKSCLMGLCVAMSLGVYADGPCYIDVLFAVDAKASAYLQDEKELTVGQYAANQLAGMNAVLTNSGLHTSFLFRSAGVYELGFEAKLVDSTKALTRDVLENATGGKGIWEDLHTERDNRGADVVSVIIDTGSEYGHVGDGNALTNLSAAAAFSESAYSVVGVRSTFAYYAVLHEIAHNMGAGHAAEVGTGSHATSAAYGYYFTGTDNVKYYTVMGYPKWDGQTPYTAAPIFSTPDRQYAGVAAGTTTKDNVSALKQTCQEASQWRSLPAKAHPFMSVAWDQHAPFNGFAPVIGSDADVPCGCAATAAAQMFKHYAWPVRIGSVFEGKTQKYVGDTPHPFPIRLDGHNDFQWTKMNDNASANDAVGNFEAARMTLWCDAMAGMDFRSGESSANFDDIAENASEWYQKGKSTYYRSDGADATFKALTNALDRGELVQVTLKGHQVVADEYRLNAGNLEVHFNYGWAGTQTGWYTRAQLEDEYAGILYVWTGFTPKKMAQLKPLLKQVASTDKIPLNWAVPQKHADDLTGFMIMAYYPSDTLQKTFTGSTGTMAADRAGTYNLTGAFGLTDNSKLSYALSSYHTSGIKVELQARFDADEWVTIDTPEISTNEDAYEKGVLVSTGWMAVTNEVDLASYAGKTAEFRFKVTRTAKTRTKDGQLFFAKPVWTWVYSPASQPLGLQGQAYKSLRSCPLSASGYAGKVVSFTIEPIMADSVVSEPVATKVVSSAVPAQPAVVSVEGVTDGFRRTCGIGKNEFIVNVNETTMKVTALPSHLALVGDDDVVEVTDLGNQTWSVAIDATDVPESSQLILTLCAEDALGNKSYKDLQLTFVAGEEPGYDAEVLATFYGFDTLTNGCYAADLNGNAVSRGDATISKGAIKFAGTNTWTGTDAAISVLVKYSGFAQPSTNAALVTIKNTQAGKMDSGVGVYSKTDDSKIHGIWKGGAWGGEKAQTSESIGEGGYLVFVYKGGKVTGSGTYLYDDAGAVVYAASGLMSSNPQTIGDVLTVGALGDNTMLATNLVVEGARIFKGALAQDEIAAAVEDFEKDMPEPETLDEMYHNRLSGGSEVIPAGKYGAISVPASGYKATAFSAATQLANTESGDEVVGSYANIIKKANKDTDIAAHTLAGWFKVDALPTAEGAGNAKTVFAAKSYDGSYGGYKVAVGSDGTVYVGQCDNEAWHDANAVVYTAPAQVKAGTWFHLAVAAPGRIDARTTTAAVFVNGQAVKTEGGPFGTNLNGNKCEYVRIGGKSETSGLGISAAGIYVDNAVLGDARAVVYVAKHVPAEVPTVRPDIVKDPSTHTWTVDTTKIGYAFTSSEIAEMKSTAWKVTLKSESEHGAMVDFGSVSAAQKSHFVIESGVHAMSWVNGNGNINFNTDGTGDDPSILVKDGATLNFTAKDITGWQGAAKNKKGNVIRVNGGGTLNLLQSGTDTHYYQGRYWLDPGATVTADFDANKFRLNGGAVEGYEQLYVPDSDEDSTPATLTVVNKLRLAADQTAGVGVYVGTHSTLEINADITSDGAQPLAKWGAGTLEINGSLADFTGALTVHAGTLKLAENVIGGSLVADEGTIVDLTYDGELSDGAVLLKAGYVEIKGATLQVNGKAAPSVYFSGGKLAVGKPLITTLLNPHAVAEGGVIKVSCNEGAENAANAYDGDWATYFAPGDVANAKGVSWTGIEFTNGVIVTEIAFSSATKRRMIGGAFQGANLADYSDATNIYVVESYSGGTVCVALSEAKGPYKYLRFIGMYGGNVSEIKYYGLADSGAAAPTNAPTVLTSWSTNGVAGLTLKADAAIPQVYVVQRAMRNFCEDESDYETSVTLAPQLGETMTWTDDEATGYALYRMQGRNVNGASAWTYFEIEPEKLIAGPVAPTFKGNGPGFYASEASVEIAYDVTGAQIYYTLDGSTPTTNSTLYTGAIVLGDVCGQENPLSQIRTNPPEMNDSHDADYGWHAPNGDQPNVNVIRARAFLSDGSASTNEIAGTWMIGPTVGDHLTNGLRVVSVITDRENYFGDPKGIMVPGDVYNEKGWVSGQVGQPNANYFQRGVAWERPAFVEMFDEKGVEMFSNKMGTRVHGNWSRAAAKKTLVCYSRKELGSKNIKLDKKKFRMFNDEPDLDKYKKYKRIMLRNGGNDWYKACLRDAVGQSMFRGYVNTGTQGYEPMAMYVNGEYWGVYNLRHAYSKQHFEEWNGAVEDDIDYVKLDPDSGDHFEVQEGDFTAMWNIMQYMITCTADGKMDDAEYAVVSNQVDIADMIDYHIMNIFLGNNDWLSNGNNMGYWRNRSGNDRKWHFTVYDCDSAMSFNGDSYSADHIKAALNVNDTNDADPSGKMAPGFLKRCFMNAGFKQRFANRFADLLNTALRVERTTNIVAQAAARIEPEIARTAARWTNMESSSKWKERLATFRAFFENRPAYQWDHILNHCGGGDYASITLGAEGAGKVKVNTIESGKHFELPFTGQYFTDIPVTLVAEPESGSEFAGWKIFGVTVSTDPTIELMPIDGVTVQAVFEEAGESEQEKFLRLWGFCGVPDATKTDEGEFIIFTNLNQNAELNITGADIRFEKTGESKGRCNFKLSGTIAAGGWMRFDQAKVPWEKITNGIIDIRLLSSDGAGIYSTNGLNQTDIGVDGTGYFAVYDFSNDTWGKMLIKDAPGGDTPTPPPGPESGEITGEITTATTYSGTAYTISNATIGAALTFANPSGVTLTLADGNSTASAKITATGTLTLTGGGSLALTGETELMEVGGFTMHGGMLTLTANRKKKIRAVVMHGDYCQDGGTVNLNVTGKADDKNALGFVWENETNETYVAELKGTAVFNATMASPKKSAAFRSENSAVAVTFGGASKVTGTFTGASGHVVDTDADIEIKGGSKVTVESTATGGSVFEASNITIKKSTIDVSATGAGTEIFSAADTIKIDNDKAVLTLVSDDDCLSAQTNITVLAKTITATSLSNDAFDSNGSITVTAGTILAYTQAVEEDGVGSTGFDTNGGAFNVNGGTVVSMGGPNSHPPAGTGGQAVWTKTGLIGAACSGAVVDVAGTSVTLPTITAETVSLQFSAPGLKAFPTIPGAEVTPVTPGETTSYETEDEATNAAAKAVVMMPEEIASATNAQGEAVIDAASYAELFNVKAVQTAMQTWELKPELKPAVSNQVQTAVDAATSNVTLMATLTTETPTAKVTMQAGLFYGMAAADAVGDVGEVAIPFERWVLGTGAEQELKSDKPGESAGFYQIRVQIEPPKK